MVDKHVPYADMIFGIMQAIIFDQQNYVLENKLSALISDHLDELQRSKILHEINPQFKSHITAIYCLPDTPPQTHSAAVNSHSIKNSSVIYYNNLGIVRLLKLFSGHKELDQFYSEILGPILVFDQKTNQSNLFETMSTGAGGTEVLQ